MQTIAAHQKNAPYRSGFNWSTSNQTLPKLRPCYIEENPDGCSTASSRQRSISPRESPDESSSDMRSCVLPPIQALWRNPPNDSPQLPARINSYQRSSPNSIHQNAPHHHSTESFHLHDRYTKVQPSSSKDNHVESMSDGRPRSSCSSNSDAYMSDVDLREDNAGLPSSLLKFKLTQPQDCDQSPASSPRSTPFSFPAMAHSHSQSSLSQYSSSERSGSPESMYDMAPEQRRFEGLVHRSAAPFHTVSSTRRTRSSFIEKIEFSTEDKGKWENFAIFLDDTKEWKCVWPSDDDSGVCGYVAKKQLVKRHLDARHLQLKPYRCLLCGEVFGQETGANTHINVHTGAKPHRCRYGKCNKQFRDASGLHRHCVREHGYKPKAVKRFANGQ